MPRVSPRVIELSSSGLDEYLQGRGGDPFNGSSSMGMRVPTLATPDFNHRYLFLLATLSVAEARKVRIVGYRQFASLGIVLEAGRYIEQQILQPNFRLPDGNISWHLMGLGAPNSQGWPIPQSTGSDLQSFTNKFPQHSALLYHDYTIAAGNGIYTQLTSYNPPNLGRPWGKPLTSGHQGTFYDQRTPWLSAQSWYSLDMEVEGPETIALFASVYQSTGFYPVVVDAVKFGNGISPEEGFIGNFGTGDEGSPHPIYWRVGGSLIVEVD
jgi:hypothetical protein